MKTDLTGMKDSLNYQGDEIDDLKGRISTLEQELDAKETVLQGEMDNLAAYVARNNFVVMGLPETEGENVALVMEEFFTRELKMTEEQAKSVKFERVHRANAKGKPRPIKARCVNFSDKVMIQSLAKNLKGSRLFIADDLPKRIREARSSQVPALKAARRAGKLAFFSRREPSKLFVDHVWIPQFQTTGIRRQAGTLSGQRFPSGFSSG